MIKLLLCGVDYMNRALLVCCIGILVPRSTITAQDARSDRFGLGPVIVAGWFGTNDGLFVGGEGFVRLARGSFWSVRLDGAFLTSSSGADKINAIQPNPNAGYDFRTIAKVGTLVATAIFGPASSNGLRPIYGVGGGGGATTRWGGGYYRPPGTNGAPGELATGAGPSFTLVEGGIGSEFRGLLNDRIELRAFRTFPTPPSDNQAIIGAVTWSLTIGVVW
jgi:hypothetical protein